MELQTVVLSGHFDDKIKNKRVDLPSGRTIGFASSTEQLIEKRGELYEDAFKRNIADAQKKYYAYSAAQFLVYGRQRLSAATELVRQEFEPFFTAYYIEKGHHYIAPYIKVLSPEDQ